MSEARDALNVGRALVRTFTPLDAWLLVASSAIAMFSVVMSSSGIGVAASLVLLAFAPAVQVAAYELRGYRRSATLAD